MSGFQLAAVNDRAPVLSACSRPAEQSVFSPAAGAPLAKGAVLGTEGGVIAVAAVNSWHLGDSP